MRRCSYCEHHHPADYFRGDMCHDCRTEGVAAHVARIMDALNQREWIRAHQRLATQGVTFPQRASTLI